MGILSKMRSRKTGEVKAKEEKKTETKKTGSRGDYSDVIPEVKDVKSWINEVKKMAEKGVRELDEYYDKIVGKSKDASFMLNLGVVAANYLSFRYEAYRKLAEYYGDTGRAIKELDKVLKDVDARFMDGLVGVIRRWLKSR